MKSPSIFKATRPCAANVIAAPECTRRVPSAATASTFTNGPLPLNPNEPRFALAKRWLKFNAVGAMGICVQLLAVFLLGALLRMDCLLATALAVEAAVLHNFIWHQRLTWADRRATTRRAMLSRLFVFNATTGLVSIAGNLFTVSLLMRLLRAPLLTADCLAVAACSLFNFVLNDKIVFRSRTCTSALTDTFSPSAPTSSSIH